MFAKIKFIIRMILRIYTARDYIRLGRMLCNTENRILKRILTTKFNAIGKKYLFDTPNFKNIGDNLVFGHPSGITVDPRAIIGQNCVLFKNSTIGSVRSGKQ